MSEESSFFEIQEPLGFVVAQLGYRIADTKEDTNRLPQIRGARGKVIFTPKETGEKVTQGHDNPLIAINTPAIANLSPRGYLLDAEGQRGIWLVCGTYVVSFDLEPTVDGHKGSIKPFEILVEPTHTITRPLDLATAVPPGIAAGATVQLVTVPAGGLPGQVLARSTTNGLVWVDPPEAPDAAPSAAAVAGFVPPRWSEPVDVTTIPIGVLADGKLYGRNGSQLMVSDDAGDSWTFVRNLGTTDGLLITIYDTTGGEVLLVREKGIYRSQGWSSLGKAGAALTKTLSAPGTSTFYQWGTDVDPLSGKAVAATYVGSMPYQHARYFWLSQDGGASWAVMYDIADHLGPTGGTTDDCHTHLAAINPWTGDIWISWHRAGLAGHGFLLRSRDNGQTWTRIANARHTVGVAVKAGMVFGTDENPNGCYFVPNNSDEHILTYRWDSAGADVTNYALWGGRSPDGTMAYLGFISEQGFPAIAVQSDGRAASLMAQSPQPLDIQRTDGYRAIMCVGDRIVAAHRYGAAWTQTTARRTTARRTELAPTENEGRVLGGRAHRSRSVAAGVGADSSYAARTTALGAGAQAKSTDASAVGDAALAVASESTALGASASAGQCSTSAGKSATATGPDAVAVGQAAEARTTRGVAVGAAALAIGARTTALGTSAEARVLGGTAVGDTAVTAGGDAVAVGASTRAGVRCTVLGTAARAIGPDATAIGAAAVIDGATFTVAVGSQASAAGNRATVMGHQARGGTGSTVIGSQPITSPTLTFATVIGSQATQMQDGGVAIGQTAQGNEFGVAIGTGATIGTTAVATSRSVAIGYQAEVASGHIRTVVLGSQTTSTASDQVQLGKRTLEIQQPDATPLPPAVTAVRVYVRELGGKRQLVGRFGTGQPVVIIAEP